MKNPNGYGSVYKLSGNRRKPFVAKKAATYDDEGRPIQQVIGYYHTRAEALQALALYNANPYDLNSAKTTISELFEIFQERKFKQVSLSTQRIYTAAYKHLSPLHDSVIRNLKAYEMQKVIDDIPRSWQTKSHAQTLLHQLFDIAMELDIVEKNYASFVKIGDRPKSDLHKPFSNEELKILWDNILKDYVDTILIMTYTGMRPSEMLQIKKENVNLEKRIMVGGIKTTAGKDRVIPISKTIYKLIERRYYSCNTYLLEEEGKPLSYAMYNIRFNNIMKALKMEHKPHDGRHTFVSLADNKGVNSVTIKKIVGHASQDITENIYTHKSIDVLLEAVDNL